MGKPTLRSIATNLMCQGLVSLSLLSGGLSVMAAETQCYSANQDSGVLAFDGVTEGRGFDGEFEDFSVRICLAGTNLETATIEVVVETGSADTNSRDRDQTLKGQEFFWANQFPQAQWSSEAIATSSGEFAYLAQGTLRIKNISEDQPVEMRLITDEAGDARLQGQAEIFRLDFNVGTGEFADTDFIENRVGVSFDLGLVPEGAN